jgi:hypothetical protein
VVRGAERIEQELHRSLIRPGSAAAIPAILAALNAAEQVMCEPAADSDPYAVAADCTSVTARHTDRVTKTVGATDHD